jgi:hypothetical protein
MSIPKLSPEVAETFKTYPAAVRPKLMKLRRLIYDTAAATEGVGPLTETLKWSEPAYLTALSKSGSTIRIGWKRSAPDRYAIYFNCQTSLVDDFRTLFTEELDFEGNRAIMFGLSDDVQQKPLAACIAMALTYHRKK